MDRKSGDRRREGGRREDGGGVGWGEALPASGSGLGQGKTGGSEVKAIALGSKCRVLTMALQSQENF